MSTALAERSILYLSFQWILSTTVMPTDMSQVGVALFPSL